MCMAIQGRATQVVTFLDALATAVPLDEFEQHLVYLRALSYHVYLDDAERARQELRKLRQVAESDDSEVLELYVDVFRDSLSEVETLPIIDRILRKPRTRSAQLQYTTLRSLLYASLGDLQAALRALQPIVDDLKRNRLAPPGWDEIHMAARLFDHRHHLTNDRSDYDEAVTYYRQVPLEHLKPYGQARLLRELGALYSRAGEHQDAVRTLRAALDVDSTDEIQVSLIFALLAAGLLEEAAVVVRAIDRANIPAALHLEYWHAAGALAVATADDLLLDDALTALRSLAFPGVYWAKVRDHIVEELTKEGTRTNRMAHLLRLANMYFELKPNIFGIGVNLNRVLERLATAFEKQC